MAVDLPLRFTGVLDLLLDLAETAPVRRLAAADRQADIPSEPADRRR